MLKNILNYIYVRHVLFLYYIFVSLDTRVTHIDFLIMLFFVSGCVYIIREVRTGIILTYWILPRIFLRKHYISVARK